MHASNVAWRWAQQQLAYRDARRAALPSASSRRLIRLVANTQHESHLRARRTLRQTDLWPMGHSSVTSTDDFRYQR